MVPARCLDALKSLGQAFGLAGPLLGLKCRPSTQRNSMIQLLPPWRLHPLLCVAVRRAF